MIALKWQLPLILLALAFAVWLLSPILPPFIAALLLAWLGNPWVERLVRAGRSRNTAVLLVFTLIALLSVLMLLVLLPLLWQQLIALLNGLPAFAAWVQDHALPWIAEKLNKDVADLLDPTSATQALQKHWQEVGSFATWMLGKAGQSTMAVVLFLSNLVLLPILSFYFLRDWHRIVGGIRRLIPRAHEAKAVQLAGEADSVLGAFLRGQMLVMVCLGVIYAIGLWVVGLKSGLLIGFIAGMVSFVPYLGALVGVIAAVIATLIQYGDINHLIWVAVVFMVGQLIESYLLTPKLVGDRIGLHPVAVIFAIMAGGQLFGFIGVLLALPAAAVLNVVFQHGIARYYQSRVYGAAPLPAPAPERPDV